MKTKYEVCCLCLFIFFSFEKKSQPIDLDKFVSFFSISFHFAKSSSFSLSIQIHTHKYPKMTLVNNCSFSMVIIQKYPYMLKIDTMKQNSSIFHFHFFVFFFVKKTLPQRIFNVNNLYYKIVCKIKPFFSLEHIHTQKKQNKTKLN